MRIEWPNTIKDDPEFKLWLEKYVFPYDGFESAAFEASNTIYEIRLQKSLLEDAVHRGITPFGISEKSLNDALLQTVKEIFQDDSSNMVSCERA